MSNRVKNIEFETLAQDGDKILNFSDLQTPTSPGFVLFDETPESITRPTTPQGLAVGLLGLAQGAGGAIEVAPYWLTVHTGLVADSQLDNHFPFGQTFSLSVVSGKKDESSFIAAGMRFRLVRFHSEAQKRDYATHIASLDATALRIARNTFRITILEDQIALLTNSEEDIRRKNQYESEIAALQAKEESIAKDLDEPAIKGAEIIEKPAFSIDLAAALGGGSETDSFDTMKLQKWAMWANVNFWLDQKISATLLGRYIDNSRIISETTEEASNAFDLGGRFNWDISSRICLSAEYIKRFYQENNLGERDRIAAIGNFKISENLYASATLGKNFGDTNNVIAIAGITIGISQNKQSFQ